MRRVMTMIAVATTAVVAILPTIASAQVDGDTDPPASTDSDANVTAPDAPATPAPTPPPDEPASAPADVVVLPADPATVEEIADTIVEQIEAAAPPAVADQTTEQTTVIAGTATATATTGSNDLVDDQPGSAGGSGGADIDTGSANAIGSRDRTAVTQEVTVVLSGDAAADVVQIALVFNIGAAFANSGGNAVAADGSGGRPGEISTGSAAAVGNDVASYMTQGAGVNASDGSSRLTSQVSVTLRIGVAVADTGQNSISGSAVAGGGGGAVGTGDATAIGNDSTTEIAQRATAAGSGSARISIEQRSTVINLGVALANSGVNEIQGLAGSLLSAPGDDRLAAELFALLLPALIESRGTGSGVGGVATGNASATGNRSQTFVEQSAVATAAGDGSATIRQNLVVANTGAAVANTGGNALGAPLVRPAIDDRTAQVVADLATFLAELLARINESSSSTTPAASRTARSIPFGELLIGIDGSLDATTTEVAGGEGTSARIRQVTAIVSVGIASADSGHNQAVVIVTDEALTSAAATAMARQFVAESSGSSITTGDATASNVGLVIVCQRADAPTVTCLRPPDADPTDPVVGGGGGTPAVTPAPTLNVPTALVRPPVSPPVVVTRPPTASRQPVRQLPATGADVGVLIAIASALVITGLVMIRVTRRPAA